MKNGLTANKNIEKKFLTPSPSPLSKQAGKTSNSALLQVLVGFLVGAVFVSVFTSGHNEGMVRVFTD